MTDISETIARVKEYVENRRDEDNKLDRLGEDILALLDAAEAGVRARDAALEECEAVVQNMHDADDTKRGRYVLFLAGNRLHALKGRPT